MSARIVSGSWWEGMGTAHQQCWILFTLELHGAEAGDKRTATV